MPLDGCRDEIRIVGAKRYAELSSLRPFLVDMFLLDLLSMMDDHGKACKFGCVTFKVLF